MKYIPQIIRYLVGGLFIFSGLIKINDPVGTSIKMEEYFDVFSVEFASFFHLLVPAALPISVFLVVLEVVLGVAIIINYRQNLTLYLLLVLIVFFTVLTGYSAITNSVTDCGCFGDAIKLTPWQSFYKDLILFVMILILMFSEHRAQSRRVENMSNYFVLAVTVISTSLAFYAIAHLPYIDFRAYKVGNHIPTEMQPSAPYVYEYVMEKDGETFKFDNYPTDKSYKFLAMNHLNPEAAPKITDFALWNNSGDFTQEAFLGPKLFIIAYDIKKSHIGSWEGIRDLKTSLGDKVDMYVLTASDGKTYREFAKTEEVEIPYFFADATVLKTIARANPGVWLLNDGTVMGKWHYNDVPNYAEVLDLVGQ